MFSRRLWQQMNVWSRFRWIPVSVQTCTTVMHVSSMLIVSGTTAITNVCIDSVSYCIKLRLILHMAEEWSRFSALFKMPVYMIKQETNSRVCQSVNSCICWWPAAWEVPGSNPCCRQLLCFSWKLLQLQLWAWAAHLLQCLGRLNLPPSEGSKLNRHVFKWRSLRGGWIIWMSNSERCRDRC